MLDLCLKHSLYGQFEFVVIAEQMKLVFGPNQQLCGRETSGSAAHLEYIQTVTVNPATVIPHSQSNSKIDRNTFS